MRHSTLLILLLLAQMACGSGSGDGPIDATGDEPIDATGTPADAPAAPADAMVPCGSGSGGPADVGVPMSSGNVTVWFPPARSHTDADMIAVRGTVAPGQSIADLRVNGVSATTSDGYDTWQASVPLAMGVNTLAVELTADDGTITGPEAQVVVTRSSDPGCGSPTVFAWPSGVSLDRDHGILWVVDSTSTRGVIAIDLATSMQTIISDNYTHGSGDRLRWPTAIEYDERTGHLWVAQRGDGGRVGILSVQRDTGHRTLIGGYHGPWALPTGVALDAAASQRVIVPYDFDDCYGECGDNAHAGGVAAFSLIDGMHTVLSLHSDNVGLGPAMSEIGGHALDVANQRMFVVSWVQHALFGVDLSSGVRTVLSNTYVGSGPNLETPTDVALHQARGRVVVTNINSIMAIDPASGERTVLSSATRGRGPFFGPGKLDLDPRAEVAYVTQWLEPAPLAVDLVTGDRVLLLP